MTTCPIAVMAGGAKFIGRVLANTCLGETVG
jgi:hypothetical protein